jgi:hypothetical protein
MAASVLSSDILHRAKWAFTTRRVEPGLPRRLVAGVDRAAPGDLLLARVATLGQHKRLHLRNGRPAALYGGDPVVVCAGARYAPDQFNADAEIAADGCDLVAAGGIAGTVRASHARMAVPTRLTPVGLLANAEGDVINVGAFALPPVPAAGDLPVFAVLGTTMNAGKTTTAAALVHGLSRAGLTVGAAKVTGTGAAGDVCALEDAGACVVVDFTDAGHATTCGLDAPALEEIVARLTGHLRARGAEAVVIEVADGVFQAETAALMRAPAFRQLVDGVLFAAAEAVGAVAGVRMVRDAGLPLAGVSGLICASPLASAEAAPLLDVPILPHAELHDPAAAAALVERHAPAKAAARRPVARQAGDRALAA